MTFKKRFGEHIVTIRSSLILNIIFNYTHTLQLLTTNIKRGVFTKLFKMSSCKALVVRPVGLIKSQGWSASAQGVSARLPDERRKCLAKSEYFLSIRIITRKY
jgi:hypothetical protein